MSLTTTTAVRRERGYRRPGCQAKASLHWERANWGRLGTLTILGDMYIREIHVERFRHLEDVQLGPFALPQAGSDLVVLAGPNGGGKSSILELIGYALSNSWSLSWALSRSFPTFAFEVAISISPNEVQLVREYAEGKRPSIANPVLDYLEEKGTYYRSYNYAGGEYQKNSNMYNEIHNLVTEALRNHYERATGFFLKADRNYSQRTFNRNSIFEYEQKSRRDHIWSMAFQTSEVQYADMYEFLVQQRYHFYRRLGAFHHRRKTEGVGAQLGLEPVDPIGIYDELLQRLFPGYKFGEGSEDVPQTLFVRLPTGETIPFTDLSSGEREVFFILSFFLRHDVSNAIVVIDEPELHLHPELARLLIRTMQSIRSGNQIVLATHNSEIIDEAGRDRVVYVARDPATRKAIVTAATNESETITKLRDLFGYSGYIGVAKNMVFLEGTNSSADRKTFSYLFPEHGSKIKFVPAQSVENLPKINSAVMAILESSLGWMKFYLIRDRDFLPTSIAQSYMERGQGKLHVLSRCHIENYLLDSQIISQTLRDIYNTIMSEAEVDNTLRSLVHAMAGEVLRDMVAFRLNLIYQPEDFSLGRIFQGDVVLDVSGSWVPAKLSAFSAQLGSKVSAINSELASRTDATSLQVLIEECKAQIDDAIAPSGDGWRVLFPGKELLARFAKRNNLGEPVVLINSLIKELADKPARIPVELRQVIDIIARGDLLAS